MYDSGIRPAIDNYLDKQASEERDYGEYWSASSAGYCMRKNIFERLKIPYVDEDPIEAKRKQRVYSAGHVFHGWIQSMTKATGLSTAQELELIDKTLKIKGHIDDLVKLDSRLVLYDYKTAHSKWFAYAQGKPMSHYHRMQLGTYLYLLHKNGKDIREARLLKISKDDLRMYEQQLMWSDKLQKDIVEYWSTLNGYWKAGKIPACTCADFEVSSSTSIGFMADKKWNPYYYQDEPCSMAWYELKMGAN